MDTRPDEEAPFDERAALAELERVRDQIQAYRAQRRAVQDEFGRFVKSFKEPQPIVTPDPPVHTQAPAPSAVPPPTALTPILEAESAAVELEPGLPPAPPRTGRTSVLAAVAALLLLALGAWLFWPDATQPPAGTITSAPPAATPQAASPPPAAAPAPAAAAPARPQTELVTIRPVWMRVIVDGARVVEREVPAGTKLPLDARETIVVRAGDGAAVRLTLAGEDQGFLGREGQPVTRTFTMPAGRR